MTPAALSDFSQKTLKNRYLLPNESPQDLFWRVAKAYSDDQSHAERMYGYISQLWFMPATPILANGGTQRGHPISCFLNETPDSLDGIVKGWNDHTWLASGGGGIGTYFGNIRSIGEPVGKNGETSGIMPFAKVTDSMTLAISQGSLRRGSAALYLPIWHPEIEEFIDMRKPTGGDYNRRCLNLHHGVVITDDFMKAVDSGDAWSLRSPKTDEVLRTVSARDLWIRLLEMRVETGEPYCLFIDTVNASIPQHHKDQGLKVSTSNLCTEIMLPTGIDAAGKNRIAVCCLSSLNLEKFLEWQDHPLFLEDSLRYLDNVLQGYIDQVHGQGPESKPRSPQAAAYSASQERSVGLGVMGFHSFLQMQGVPFESVAAKSWNKRIFSHIRRHADAISIKLADERGPCPDAQRSGVHERFSNKLAIAPTASISIICNSASPGIEPLVANAFTQKTLSGSFPVYNPHLVRLMEKKGLDIDDMLQSIAQNSGSIAHLSDFSDLEKAIYKTAFEINQMWLIDLAAQRQPYICQGQSLNLFIHSNEHKKVLHHLHYAAWKKGVKSLYYLRSQSLQRAETEASFEASRTANQSTDLPLKYDECLSCQ